MLALFQYILVKLIHEQLISVIKGESSESKPEYLLSFCLSQCRLVSTIYDLPLSSFEPFLLFPHGNYEFLETLQPITECHGHQVPVKHREKHFGQFSPVYDASHIRFFSRQLKQKWHQHAYTHWYACHEHVEEELWSDQDLRKGRHEGPTEEEAQKGCNC